MTDKISLQEYADKVVAPEYRQKLKTAEQLIEAQGWDDAEKPFCCGVPVTVSIMIGQPYYAECKSCGKFAASIDGPSFANASVSFLDGTRVDLETEERWIIGIAPDTTLARARGEQP